MKNQYLLFMITFVFIVLVSFIPAKVMATSWSYPFVVWDGYVYAVSEESVTAIGDEIGQVTNYSDMEPQSGNFSNDYQKGTKYFEIKGVSTEEAIAVQKSNDQYVKADRRGEYEFEQTSEEPLENLKGVIYSIVGILAIIFIYIILKYPRGKK